MNRFALRDDQWERIKDLLPGKPGDVGVTARDNRRFVEAVLFRYRAGIPWRDLPEEFGDWKNTHRRFSRWAEKGRCQQVMKYLAADADNEYAMIDTPSCGLTSIAPSHHSIGHLIAFSTETGDVWLLDTTDRFAARLAKDGESEPIRRNRHCLRHRLEGRVSHRGIELYLLRS